MDHAIETEYIERLAALEAELAQASEENRDLKARIQRLVDGSKAATTKLHDVIETIAGDVSRCGHEQYCRRFLGLPLEGRAARRNIRIRRARR